MENDFIAAFDDVALEILHPLNEYLIEDICRRAAKAGEITKMAMYDTYRMAAMEASSEALKQALKKQAVLTDKSIAELFEFFAKKTMKFEDNGSLRQMLEAYIKLTQEATHSITDHLGITIPSGEVLPIGEAYGEIMDFAFKQTFTGATDYTTALREATSKLASRGVRYITTPGGRTVGIEYATRQNLMTNMGKLNMEIAQKNHDVLGCNGWEISAHAACAEDHEDIQGRQFSDADYEKINSRLKRPIGYFYCGHIIMPINLESNSPQYTEAQLQEMKRTNAAGVTYQGRHYTLYEATQEQGDMESSIRTMRTSILADRALGDDENLAAHQIHLVRLQEEYKSFSEATGLPTQNERLQVAGFGRSESAAARAAYRRLAG
jgi:hypothetical protein